MYHLGVIKFLRDAGILNEVTHIFSVSGGSILAAHLVLNWEKYNGSEEDFEKMAEQIIQLTKSDVRGKVIRKWILSWLLGIIRPLLWLLRKFKLLEKPDWRITNLLASIYSKFYRYKDGQGNWQEAKLADFKANNLSRPEIHILSTSVTTGRLCSFDNSGFTLMNETNKNEVENSKRIDTDIFPVSTAVAASSAFPPVFSPVAIKKEMFQASEAEFPHTEYLTDGGVYDNLGIRRLFLLQEAEENIKFGRVFISDAGTAFDSKLNEPFSFILTLSIRASNLLMMRVGSLEYLGLKNVAPDDIKVAICKIQDEIREKDKVNNIKHSLNIDTQRAMECIRTDLNAFSSWEINALTQHGYATARKAYFDSEFEADDLQRLKEISPWIPGVTKNVWSNNFHLETQMKIAKRRKWGLWSLNDVNSWISTGILLLVISSFFIPLIYFRILENRQTELLQSQKDKLEVALQEIATQSNPEENQKTAVKTLLETNPDNEIFSKYKSAVVKITFQNTVNQSRYRETGFFISEDGYILTAKLFDTTSQKIIIDLIDGTQREAKLVDSNGSERLALLKIDNNEKFEFLTLSMNEPVSGSSIIGIGFISRTEISSETGIVTGKSKDFIQIQFDKDEDKTPDSLRFIAAGLNGGPIMDFRGRVVGIYYDSDGKSIRYCVPSAEAIQYLTKLGIFR